MIEPQWIFGLNIFSHNILGKFLGIFDFFYLHL